MLAHSRAWINRGCRLFTTRVVRESPGMRSDDSCAAVPFSHPGPPVTPVRRCAIASGATWNA